MRDVKVDDRLRPWRQLDVMLRSRQVGGAEVRRRDLKWAVEGETEAAIGVVRELDPGDAVTAAILLRLGVWNI